MHLYEYQMLSQMKKEEVERSVRHAWKWQKALPIKKTSTILNSANQQLSCCEA